MTHKQKIAAFRDAMHGKNCELSTNEVLDLLDGLQARSHEEAVNEILEKLGWL